MGGEEIENSGGNFDILCQVILSPLDKTGFCGQGGTQQGANLPVDDLLDDEEEEEDDDEEEDEEPNIPQGAINAFLGYDTGDVGEKLSGNVSLTNDQLYSEVKERVLDTAGGFVDFVQGASTYLTLRNVLFRLSYSQPTYGMIANERK